ncbi:MAG: radical SAM protein [Elusimicrobiota bacterium]
MIRPGFERLELYLTSRCNLECRYCPSARLASAGEARSLGVDDLVRAVDLFAEAGAPGASRRVIAFMGGEPFLEFEAVSRAIDHIRAQREGFEVCIATNGTLLAEPKLRFLLERDVNVAVSLDGGKALNDSLRRFRRAPRKSVFDAVARNLKNLPEPMVRRLHGMVTVTPETAPCAAAEMEALLRLGFSHLDLSFDYYELWTTEKIARMRGALGRIRELCIRRFSDRCLSSEGGDGFGISFMQDSWAKDETAFGSLYLSPDGLFFPCSTLCWSESGREYAVGSLRDGVDRAKVALIHGEVADFAPQAPCPPIDRYFYALLEGLDPRRMLEGLDEVDAMVEREMGCLAGLERRIRKHKKAGLFEGFEREPARKARSEVPFLAIPVGLDARDALERARQAADYCLHSPGDGKCLAFRAADLGACFAAVEGAALYSILKARRLGKRLRVLIEGDAEGLDAEALRFIRDNGFFLGTTGRWTPDAHYAVLRFGRETAAGLGRMAGGAERVRLELRGSEGLWSDDELDAMARGLEELAQRDGPALLDLAWAEDDADPRAARELRRGLDRLALTGPTRIWNPNAEGADAPSAREDMGIVLAKG